MEPVRTAQAVGPDVGVPAEAVLAGLAAPATGNKRPGRGGTQVAAWVRAGEEPGCPARGAEAAPAGARVAVIWVTVAVQIRNC